MDEPRPAGVLLHVAEGGKVVQDLATRARAGRNGIGVGLDGPHLLERERVAFDGCGRMGIASAGVLLEGGDPRYLDGRALNLLPERGNGLHPVEEHPGDGELWLVAHPADSS